MFSSIASSWHTACDKYSVNLGRWVLYRIKFLCCLSLRSESLFLMQLPRFHLYFLFIFPPHRCKLSCRHPRTSQLFCFLKKDWTSCTASDRIYPWLCLLLNLWICGLLVNVVFTVVDFVKKVLIVYPEDLILQQRSVSLFVFFLDLHGVFLWLLALCALITICIAFRLLLRCDEWCWV